MTVKAQEYSINIMWHQMSTSRGTTSELEACVADTKFQRDLPHITSGGGHLYEAE